MKKPNPVQGGQVREGRMSDQCKHCKYDGDIESCQMTDCTYHDIWYTRYLKQRIAELDLENTELGAEVAALKVEKAELEAELATLKYTIVSVIGGVDYEGFPTSEINYLQRLRILLEKEAELAKCREQLAHERVDAEQYSFHAEADKNDLRNQLANATDSRIPCEHEKIDVIGVNCVKCDLAVTKKRVEILERQLTEAKAEIEHRTVQFAGISVAAFGGTQEPAKEGDYGWSVPYQDVLNLRIKYDHLREGLRKLEWGNLEYHEATCPVCDQFDPNEKHICSDEHYGHKPDCWLDALLKEDK